MCTLKITILVLHIFLLNKAIDSVDANSDIQTLCSSKISFNVVRFPFEEDFRKFWECSNGLATLKSCPNNQNFNQVIENCQTLNDVPVFTNSFVCDSESVDFLPHPNDCSKYIWCYYGTPYVIDCDEGLWFSPAEKKCVQPVVAGCSSTSEPPWTTPNNNICTDVPDGEIVLKKCECGCMYYWECRGKKQTLRECEYKLVFLEDRQFCAGLIWCEDATRTPFPWTTTFPTTIVSRPDYDDPRCNGKDGIYLPHPDCTKFTQCNIGRGDVWNCPSGLYFNAKESKCGMLSESTCENFSTLTTPTDTTFPTTDTPPFTADPRCNPDGTLDLLPHPTDCSKYIQCYNGDSYLLSCPDGQWFDVGKKICMDASEADCGASATTKSLVDHLDQKCRGKDGSFLPHPTDRRTFFECYEGNSYERSCSSGLHFDSKNERCVSPKLSN